MSKSIELSNPTLGATMLELPIDAKSMRLSMWKEIRKKYKDANELLMKDMLSLQKGDKDVWVKEDVFISNLHCRYYTPVIMRFPEKYETISHFEPASQMTKEQSRLSIDEVLDARVVRVQDITLDECLSICGVRDYKYLYNYLETYIEHRVDVGSENPYVLLLETTPIKEKDK